MNWVHDIAVRLKWYWHGQQALRYRNYRLFIIGQTLSLIGTWIQRIAMMWLAYQLTHSAGWLGIIGFCEQIPIFIIAPFAGVFADRWNKQKALARIESLAMLQAFLLGILTFMKLVNVWHLIGLSLFLGTVNAFEVPVRQSFVVEMVNRDKTALVNAIALNSTIFNLSRLMGPSVAGVLIATVGEGWCFFINALSYAVVVICVMLMRISFDYSRKSGEDTHIVSQLKEGLHYVFHHEQMARLLGLLAIVSFVNASLRTLAPVFAKQVLHGGAGTFGLLMSASGVGAISAALYLTNRKTLQTMLRIVSLTGITLAAGMMVFAISHVLWLSLACMAVTGFAQMLHTATTNTLLQIFTEDDKRGRVMSFYTMSLQGTMPFGSLVAGVIGDELSASWAVGLMGGFCLLASLWLRHRPVHVPTGGKNISENEQPPISLPSNHPSLSTSRSEKPSSPGQTSLSGRKAIRQKSYPWFHSHKN
ncbi:MFS-type transporter involved in bile tolerance (Atg22 family) [Thermoflavifilum aggregans]|uniref:MFS-type transporter involved in bile tolerance (Atg22 family) n=1 Tax=Thermoflavifilum aggregans TaxID=454188 RepID=A0A2M9CXY4_9BACT|nr:MFS transporter [Thermoflavifilum aggregans]PJJ76743.1 MFS-type transporter involved in bile tolerance (Atg22 family) [Thermoflavifilum aggregans]